MSKDIHSENVSINVPQPPPLPLSNPGKVNQDHHSSTLDNVKCLSKGDWYDIAFNDVSNKCGILNIACTKDKIWMHPVPTLLQVGPTCGLVALCMFANSIGRASKVEDLLHISQVNGYTKQGEMFSTKNLKALCDIVLGPDTVIVQHQTNNLASDKPYIIRELKSGAVILIAYDNDYNFDPCLRNGESAHWALIFGLIETDDGDPYLLARQGKSSHVGVWKLSSLSESNGNLHDAGTERCNGQYVIPTEGIGRALCNQYLILKQSSQCTGTGPHYMKHFTLDT